MCTIAKKQHTAGFTLIEMLVSLGLFSVAVTIGMGSLLVMVDANSKSQATQTASTNMSFAMDSMTRLMRTGYDINCQTSRTSVISGGSIVSGARSCPTSGGQAIAFTDSRTGDRYAYAINGTSIQRRVDSGGTDGEWQNLTGPNVRVTDLQFLTTGTGVGDEQPLTTIFIAAEVGSVSGLGAEIRLQTTVAQRRIKL